jgi:hypothetical protein
MIALQKALADLETGIHRRDILNAKIAGLRETVRVLSGRVPLSKEARERIGKLVDMVDCATPSLADSIRTMLTRSLPKGMTAMEVRSALEDSQFNFDDFSNPLSACHAALKRMLADEEVQAEQTKDGKVSYRRILRWAKSGEFSCDAVLVANGPRRNQREDMKKKGPRR